MCLLELYYDILLCRIFGITAFNFCGGILSGKKSFHQLIKKLDVAEIASASSCGEKFFCGTAMLRQNLL